MYNILENIQKEKQMFKKETEKMSNRLKYTEAAFFELRNQHLKCLHSMELKDQEIAHLKSIVSDCFILTVNLLVTENFFVQKRLVTKR
jgi:hypothetical protein